MWVALILVGLLTLLIYYVVRPPKNFWGKYGVRQVNDTNFKDKLEILLNRKSIMDIDTLTYNSLDSSEKFCGLVDVMGNTVLIKDLDLSKKVMIKDFEYFMDRRLLLSSDSQPIFRKFLLNLHGEEWKSVRSSLSPTFTTTKIKRMMEYLNKVGDEWVERFQNKIEKDGDNSLIFKVGEETTHFTVDVIASAVFGMEGKAVTDPNSVFAAMSARLLATGPVQIVKFLTGLFLPKLSNFLGIKVIDEQALNFFQTVLKQGMEERMSGRIKRNDFLQLVAEVRKGELKSQGGEELSAFEKDAKLSDQDGKKNVLKDDNIAIAQLLQFFFAGLSTTSHLISFALYILALNPDVQKKLRDELDSKLFQDGNDKDVDYDNLSGLVYLDMFICEVLRKTPTAGRIERICVKDYYDQETGLRVPKGAYLFMPLPALHNDPKYFEHPDKFYPEHFTPEKKAARNQYAYAPFGIGPRNCIGMRLANVKSKLAIAKLVQRFVIEPAPSTPKPFQVRTIGLANQPPDNLQLKLSPRSNLPMKNL